MKTQRYIMINLAPHGDTFTNSSGQFPRIFPDIIVVHCSVKSNNYSFLVKFKKFVLEFNLK